MILAFIGVKLVFEALHGSHVEHLGPIPLPHIGIAASLCFILGVLLVTVVASLSKQRRDLRRSEGWPAAPDAQPGAGRLPLGRAATIAS